MGFTHWFGDEPSVSEYYLPLTYYFKTSSKFYPYVGLTYKYNSFSKYMDDYSSVVTRIGAAYKVSFGYMGFGYAYDISLDNNIKNNSYPEFIVGFSF
jgi:outer membrane protein W